MGNWGTASFGEIKALNAIRTYLRTNLQTHLTAVEAAAVVAGYTALDPVPTAPPSNGFYLWQGDIGPPKRKGVYKRSLIIRPGVNRLVDRSNRERVIEGSIWFGVSETTGQPENLHRRLATYGEALHLAFETKPDAEATGIWIIQIGDLDYDAGQSVNTNTYGVARLPFTCRYLEDSI